MEGDAWLCEEVTRENKKPIQNVIIVLVSSLKHKILHLRQTAAVNMHDIISK